MDGRVLPEKRDYQRIEPSQKSRQRLRERGFTWVLSSNVSAVRTHKTDLYIRFHNGSLYKYPNRANLFEPMLGSSSKGRFVWNELRRKNVAYSKVGAMPLEEDIQTEDEEIMQPLIDRNIMESLKIREDLTLSKLFTYNVDDFDSMITAITSPNLL